MRKKVILVITLTILMQILNAGSAFATTIVTSNSSLGVSLQICNSDVQGAYINANDIDPNNSNALITAVYVHFHLMAYDTAWVIYRDRSATVIDSYMFSPTVDYDGSPGILIPPSGTYSVTLRINTVGSTKDGYRAVWYTEINTSSIQMNYPVPTGSNGLPMQPTTPSTPSISGSTLSWPSNPSSDGVTGYNVSADGTNIGSVPAPADGSTPTYDLSSSGLAPGTHSITVSAVNPNGTSEPSASVTYTADCSL